MSPTSAHDERPGRWTLSRAGIINVYWAFAHVLVDDLIARATVDEAGARWSNYEHRADPPALPTRPGWAMGNAGIVRELLRYARLRQGGDGGYAVRCPDQLMACWCS